MDMKQAVDRLYYTYGKYGIEKDLIERLFIDGIENQGFSTLATFNLLRMSLGVEFHHQEYFSFKEIAEMLDTSEDGVKQQIEKMQEQDKAKQIETANGWQWYFPSGLKWR